MKHTTESLHQMKYNNLIPMLTAYTYPVARSLEQAGIPLILVGDTVGMVEMGFDSTRHVTMDHMVYHIGAVRRGAPNTHIIGDMPFSSDCDPETALTNARALIEAGADSIKLEGPKYDVISHLVANGIEVVGHTGLTPQTAVNFKKVGVKEEDAERVYCEAVGIEKSGAFMLVLEHIPASLAERITVSLNIPTIGIGAGEACDGQVLVINDLLGLGDGWPPFSKQYAYFGKLIQKAGESFIREVREQEFPNNLIQLKCVGNS